MHRFGVCFATLCFAALCGPLHKALEASKQEAESLRRQETAEFQKLKADASEAKDSSVDKRRQVTSTAVVTSGRLGPAAEGDSAASCNVCSGQGSKST